MEKINAMKETYRLKISIAFCIYLIAYFYYFSWWLEGERLSSILLLILLAGSSLFCIVRGFLGYYIYLQCKFPKSSDVPEGLSIDVLVPAYNEPESLVRRTLTAAKRMHCLHRTILLDDSGRTELEELARELDVVYFRRETNWQNKAGNINYALQHTTSEIIVIFDVDHMPCVDFLIRSLGPFKDPNIGFVQVRLDHSNSSESFVAGAAAERNDGFFGAPLHGMHGCGCPQKFGSNCLIRRKALESIGGYKPGLAEDLHTSLRLHVAGWRSYYVSETLAFGLEPTELSGFFIQQYKWCYGVTELLIHIYPKYISKLNFNTNICYMWRLTCFIAGPAVALCIISTAIVLCIGSQFTIDSYASYLVHLAPMVIIMSMINNIASKQYNLKLLNNKSRIPMGGMLLAFASWPVYTHSCISATLGLKANFMPTPKGRESTKLKQVFPQMLAVSVLMLGIVYSLSWSNNITTFAICIFALMLITMHSAVFFALLEERAQYRLNSIQ